MSLLNGVVEIAGLALFGAVVVSAALVIIRRRSSGDIHSVDGYRQTLSTLQTIRSRSSSSSVRVLDDPETGTPSSSFRAVGAPTEAGSAPGDLSPPPVDRSGVSGGAGIADPGSPAAAGWAAPIARRPSISSQTDVATPPGGIVFDDIARHVALSTPTGSRTRVRNRRQQRAMTAMNRGPRRIGGPIAAGVVVLALVVTLLVIGARSPNHPRSTTGTTTSSTQSHRGRTTATTSTHAGSHTTVTTHAASKSKSGGGAPRTTTTTTQPAQFAPVSTSSSGATYAPPAAAYTLVVSTSTGRCWVEVQATPGGSVLFANTLDAGAQQSLPTQGEVSVVLGAPSVVSVTLNGAPVVFPSGSFSPLILTFAPPAQPASTTPSSTTPSSTTRSSAPSTSSHSTTSTH
jgi:hypothetical protein